MLDARTGDARRRARFKGVIDTLGATTASPLMSENGMLNSVMHRASHQAPSSRR